MHLSLDFGIMLLTTDSSKLRRGFSDKDSIRDPKTS